jgi:hypothetical protein
MQSTVEEKRAAFILALCAGLIKAKVTNVSKANYDLHTVWRI